MLSQSSAPSHSRSTGWKQLGVIHEQAFRWSPSLRDPTCSCCQARPQGRGQAQTLPCCFLTKASSAQVSDAHPQNVCYSYGSPTLKRHSDFSSNTNQYSYNQLFFDSCSTYSVIIYLSECWLYCNFHSSRFTCASQLSHVRLHSIEW